MHQLQSSKKDKFYEVSLKLIHEKGFRGTTMRDIAEKMNFEVANIYNYIDSKQSLLENILFSLESEIIEHMENIVASSYSPKEKLKALIAFHVQLPSKKPLEVSLLYNEWRNLSPPKKVEFLQSKKKYERQVKELLKDCIDKGEFRSMDVYIATHTILSSMRWIYDVFAIKGADINPVELEKQVLDLIFKGIENCPD